MFRKSVCVRVVFAVGAVSLLTGCATNAVRLQRAETMVSASREAGKQTRVLMEETRQANRSLLVDIVATDPRCRFLEPRMLGGARNLPPDRLCRYAGDRLANSSNDWTFHRINEKDFEPTVEVIRSLAVYLDAVDKVVTRDKLDLTGEITAARDDVQAVYDAAAALGGGGQFPALDSAQEAALSNVFDLLSTLIDESGRVRDLRAIESGDNQKLFERSAKALEQANKKWLERLKGQLVGRKGMLEQRLLAMSKASAAERRPIAEDLLELTETIESIPAMDAALQDVVAAMRESHAGYLDLLFNDDAELTDKEREFIATENHNRVMRALKSFTAIVTAF